MVMFAHHDLLFYKGYRSWFGQTQRHADDLHHINHSLQQRNKN